MSRNNAYPIALWSLILSLLVFTCQSKGTSSPPAEDEAITVLRQPAEYDPQEAVWLIWSPVDHLEGYSNEQVTLQIIEALAPHTRVVVTAVNEELMARAQSAIPDSLLDKGQVELLQIPSEELWVRDMGPNFVEMSDGKKAIVDFNFDAWGYTPIDEMDEYTIRMEKYDEAVAEKKDIPYLSTNMVSEGGNREVNGRGVMMVGEAVEQGRNPNMTKAEMEAEFKRVLGVEKVIWLKEGLYEDDHTFRGPLTLANGEKAYTVVTTNGHIDEFARFVNDSTILLAKVPESDRDDPIALENHRRLEENLAILQQATDQNNQPFKIIRMPLPKLVLGKMRSGDSVYDFISTLDYEDGSVFPLGEEINVIAAASYLNFLITDQVVIGQKYWRPGLDEGIKKRDEQVAQQLQEIFPDKEIIMLDALAINFGGGGIHCITMHEPII